jgi:hypothetical protein
MAAGRLAREIVNLAHRPPLAQGWVKRVADGKYGRIDGVPYTLPCREKKSENTGCANAVESMTNYWEQTSGKDSGE